MGVGASLGDDGPAVGCGQPGCTGLVGNQGYAWSRRHPPDLDVAQRQPD
jgi:hypothetical protein